MESTRQDVRKKKTLENHNKLLCACWNTKPILKINTRRGQYNVLKVKKNILSSSVMTKCMVPKMNLTKDVESIYKKYCAVLFKDMKTKICTEMCCVYM